MSDLATCDECGAVVTGSVNDVTEHIGGDVFGWFGPPENPRREQVVTGHRWLPCGHSGPATVKP